MGSGDNKIFKLKGRVYNIPEEEVQSFLRDNPGAESSNVYNLKGKTYVVPSDKSSNFININPMASLIPGVKGDNKPKFTKLDQRIINTVPAIDYSDSMRSAGNRKKLIKDIVQNNPHEQTGIDAEQEMFAYSLGKGGVDDLQYFESSPFKPSISSDEKSSYLRMKSDYVDKQNMLNFYARTLTPGTSDFSKISDAGVSYKNNENFYDPFANITLSLGEDEKGKYMSMYDKWDLSDKRANKLLDRKPEFYDRIYYKEIFLKPELEPQIRSAQKELGKNRKIYNDHVKNNNAMGKYSYKKRLDTSQNKLNSLIKEAGYYTKEINTK